MYVRRKGDPFFNAHRPFFNALPFPGRECSALSRPGMLCPVPFPGRECSALSRPRHQERWSWQSSSSRRSASKAQHEVQRGLLVDVVVRQGAAILQLLAHNDKDPPFFCLSFFSSLHHLSKAQEVNVTENKNDTDLVT